METKKWTLTLNVLLSLMLIYYFTFPPYDVVFVFLPQFFQMTDLAMTFSTHLFLTLIVLLIFQRKRLVRRLYMPHMCTLIAIQTMLMHLLTCPPLSRRRNNNSITKQNVYSYLFTFFSDEFDDNDSIIEKTIRGAETLLFVAILYLALFKKGSAESQQKQELEFFFKQYDPSKVSQVDAILKQNVGRERYMWNLLKLKYIENTKEDTGCDGDVSEKRQEDGQTVGRGQEELEMEDDTKLKKKTSRMKKTPKEKKGLKTAGVTPVAKKKVNGTLSKTPRTTRSTRTKAADVNGGEQILPVAEFS